MKKLFTPWLLRIFMCLGANSALALQINQTSSTNFYVDFSDGMGAAYVSFMVTNTDGTTYSNLWATLDSFTNAAMKLGGNDPGRHALGTLANNQSKPFFFYLQATNDPANGIYKDRFTIKLYSGSPDTGTLIASSNFLMAVTDSTSNQADIITALTYTPTNNLVLGTTFKISVQGMTGNVKAGNDMDFTPATSTNWNASAFELIGCNIVVTDSPNYVLNNVLMTYSATHITGAGDPYQADYWFRIVAATTSNTPANPVNFLNNGGGSVNHTPVSSLLALPPLPSPTNLTVMTPLTNFAQLYTNETVTISLRFTNFSAADVTMDRVVDTLPPGFVYVSNSCTFGGVPVLNPTVSGQLFTWSQDYFVAAGSSRNFVFQAVPLTTGYATNSAIAYIKNTQIDTTLNLTDNAPANETIQVLVNPSALGTTNTVTNAFGLARSIIRPRLQNATVQFEGAAGSPYDVERTTNLATAIWTPIWTTSAPPNGVWSYVDTNRPAAGAFYRARLH